jgi:NADP-dependent 3-hydroxy acid dehydrogenase YdfG
VDRSLTQQRVALVTGANRGIGRGIADGPTGQLFGDRRVIEW